MVSQLRGVFIHVGKDPVEVLQTTTRKVSKALPAQQTTFAFSYSPSAAGTLINCTLVKMLFA